nr:MAG TPA: hypothetical protein [Caudoviricetes sp.]
MNKLTIDNKGVYLLDGIKLECLSCISAKEIQSDGSVIAEIVIDVVCKEAEAEKPKEQQAASLLDQTIDDICRWVQTELREEYHENGDVPEMVNALAALITAKEKKYLPVDTIIDEINKKTRSTGKSPFVF